MEKYKILIFGDKTFGDSTLSIFSDLYEVQFIRFPEEDSWSTSERLANYSIIILDYAAFYIKEKLYRDVQDIFVKQLVEALDKGTTLCFLFYNELVQGEAPSPHYGPLKNSDLTELQIGLRFLNWLSIKPVHLPHLIPTGEIRRSEFKEFLEKWGTSKNCFKAYGEGKFGDIIYSVRDFALAFSKDFKKGLIIYIPCQRNLYNLNDLKKMFEVLIESLITYITRFRTEIPDWAKEPLFEEERLLVMNLKETENKLEDIKNQIEPFKIAKSLAFASEYKLQNELPKFLKDHIGLNIKQSETHNEDFWILDSTDKQIAICEIKSYVKGFKKGGIYDLYNHREHYNLDESFPAILFVNANLNSINWKNKMNPIAPQEFQNASSLNILVLRVEDLLFIWDGLKNNKRTKEEILELLLTNKGWLKFNSDYTYEIKK